MMRFLSTSLKIVARGMFLSSFIAVPAIVFSGLVNGMIYLDSLPSIVGNLELDEYAIKRAVCIFLSIINADTITGSW